MRGHVPHREVSTAWGWSTPSAAEFTPDTWGEQVAAGHLWSSTVYTTVTINNNKRKNPPRYQASRWLPVFKCVFQGIHQHDILIKKIPIQLNSKILNKNLFKIVNKTLAINTSEYIRLVILVEYFLYHIWFSLILWPLGRNTTLISGKGVSYSERKRLDQWQMGFRGPPHWTLWLQIVYSHRWSFTPMTGFFVFVGKKGGMSYFLCF